MSTFVWQISTSPLNKKGYSIMKSKLKDLAGLILASAMPVIFLLCRCIKVSPILGSDFAFFSLSDVMMPLSGLFGLSFSLFMIVLRMGYRIIFLASPFSSVLYHLPGFCASAYWAVEGVAVRLLLPLVCMVLFIAHPVGFKAAAYSLYWLIPVAIYFSPRKTVFLTSLGSTFVAHAVGSVIWLYSFDLSSAAWLALIPLVAVERILFACAMTVVYFVGSYFKQALLSFYSVSKSSIGYVK